MIYPPSFTCQYVHWWENRGSDRRISPIFTCMLLRVCAYASQDVGQANRQKLETELGDLLTTLNDRMNKASRRLSSLIRPGIGGIVHVQQLFLTAS